MSQWTHKNDNDNTDDDDDERCIAFQWNCLDDIRCSTPLVLINELQEKIKIKTNRQHSFFIAFVRSVRNRKHSAHTKLYLVKRVWRKSNAVVNSAIFIMDNYIKEIKDFAIACWIFNWILMKTDAKMIGERR